MNREIIPTTLLLLTREGMQQYEFNMHINCYENSWIFLKSARGYKIKSFEFRYFCFVGVPGTCLATF